MNPAETRAAAAAPDAPPLGAEPLLAVEGLSKSFRGLRAVAQASLSVARGEIVALIGPNGAGKTTLFNLVAGALAPDSGSVRFQGVEIAGRSAERVCAAGIGRTFQIVKPFADMTVLENAMVGFRGTADRALARARAERALRALDMWPERHRPASALTLPAGKRLEVARALATEPAMLLLEYRQEENANIRLEIGLDLYEMLQHIRQGYTPSLNELRGSFVSLLIFKRQLASTRYDEVLLTQDEEQYYRVYQTDPKKLVLTRESKGN